MAPTLGEKPSVAATSPTGKNTLVTNGWQMVYEDLVTSGPAVDAVRLDVIVKTTEKAAKTDYLIVDDVRLKRSLSLP